MPRPALPPGERSPSAQRVRDHRARREAELERLRAFAAWAAKRGTPAIRERALRALNPVMEVET